MRQSERSIVNSDLMATHSRLKNLTDIVQVSSLIVQSAATRRNTSLLTLIGSDIALPKRGVTRLFRSLSLLNTLVFAALALLAINLLRALKAPLPFL